MANNNRPVNLGFERDSIITQHGIFALLVDTLNNQIQVKYQSMQVSPFDTHKRVMSTFFVALFVYATASVVEIILRTRDSIYRRLVGNIRLFASALATVLLLIILDPISGCIISVLWACFFASIAYNSCQDLYRLLCETADKVRNCLNGLIGVVNTSKEESNQPNV